MASKRVQIQGVVNPEERVVLFRTAGDEECNAVVGLFSKTSFNAIKEHT